MNLFIFDLDHDINAKYHCDKHVSKMVLEAAQLICTTHWVSDVYGYTPKKVENLEPLKALAAEHRPLPQETRRYPYLPAHVNHPCAIWVRSSLENYYWTYCYAHSLAIESQRRKNGSWHKSMKVLESLPDIKLINKGLTPFALAMPDQYKSSDAVEAYRAYFCCEKRHLAEWSNTKTPEWYN